MSVVFLEDLVNDKIFGLKLMFHNEKRVKKII